MKESFDDLNALIRGCRKGDADSYRRLVDLYSSQFYGYFYRLSGSPDISEELLSELFVKLVEKIGTYHGAGFNAWLFKVASNVFYDHLRRKKRNKVLAVDDEVLDGFATGKDDNAMEDADEIGTGLAKLDEETRELIVMRFYSDMSFKEIAKLRCEPIGTTLSKVHRGLKKLRELLEQSRNA